MTENSIAHAEEFIDEIVARTLAKKSQEAAMALRSVLSRGANRLAFLAAPDRPFPVAFDERSVQNALVVWRQLLDWGIDMGYFPESDFWVDSYEWRSCGKYTVPTIERGWLPDTID